MVPEHFMLSVARSTGRSLDYVRAAARFVDSEHLAGRTPSRQAFEREQMDAVARRYGLPTSTAARAQAAGLDPAEFGALIEAHAGPARRLSADDRRNVSLTLIRASTYGRSQL